MFVLEELENRRKCRRCGARRITAVFEVPDRRQAAQRSIDTSGFGLLERPRGVG
jgi:hypothetical protein